MSRAILLALLLSTPLAAHRASADDPETSVEPPADFEQRVKRLEKRGPQKPGVARPLEAAKLALRRAKAAEAAGHKARAVRALALAQAALGLAEARAAYLQELELTRAARDRRELERRHVAAAERALSVTRPKPPESRPRETP